MGQDLRDASDSESGRTSDALMAAHLYYLQDKNMEAIAKEMHTSRSSVSRLLSYAREAGLVEIQIRSPEEPGTRIKHEFLERYGITIHPVPVPSRITDVDRLERVALSAAQILTSLFDSNMTIGIAWGSTLNAISRHLVPKELRNSRFVQLNGAGNIHTTGVFYASEILRRFGDAYSANIQEFPVPAFFDDPAAKRALWRERSIRRVLDLQHSMDASLFGLGAVRADVPSHVYTGGYLDPEDYLELAASGVVGDIATVFYRADGSSENIALNTRASGPDLAVIRHSPRRICVVSGRAKVESIRGALAAGLITNLIVDEPTARDLLDD